MYTILSDRHVDDIVNFIYENDLNNTKKFCFSSPWSIKYLKNESIVRQAIFNGEMVVIGEIEDKVLTNIAIISIPKSYSRRLSVDLQLLSIHSPIFVKEALKLCKEVFQDDKFIKLKVSLIENNLKMIDKLREIGFESELKYIINGREKNILSYFFKEAKNVKSN